MGRHASAIRALSRVSIKPSNSPPRLRDIVYSAIAAMDVSKSESIVFHLAGERLRCE